MSQYCYENAFNNVGYAYNIVGNTSLWCLQYDIVERATTRLNMCCMLEKMFDRNLSILPTKYVEQTSSNMHATRSNIVDPINVS